MALLESVYRGILGVHQAIYEKTDGALGHRLLGVPTLLLRTTGRRTGKRRTSGLVYAREGPSYVLVASNGGSDRPPGWLLNVRENPEVEVQIGRRRMPATARVVGPGEPDYDRLWKLANDHNGGRYARYQTRTDRPILVVVVTPVEG